MEALKLLSISTREVDREEWRYSHTLSRALSHIGSDWV